MATDAVKSNSPRRSAAGAIASSMRRSSVTILQALTRRRAAGSPSSRTDFSPAFVRSALEASLRRLQTDYVDIYQMHNARMAQIEDDALWELLESLKREGKIRMYGVALGPAIGWLYEGVDAVRERNVASLQIIWNMLEQYPGDEQIRAAYESGAQTGYMIRVPHSSGMLEGHYTAETTFPKNDHRRHRPHEWLVNGIEKVRQLRFLERPDRTLGQAAIAWLLHEPRVMTVLPNIYDREQLAEFAAAPEAPALTAEELARIDELYRTNFGIEEPPMAFKGTMTREQSAPALSGAQAMKAEHIATPHAPQPIGPYSQAVQCG